LSNVVPMEKEEGVRGRGGAKRVGNLGVGEYVLGGCRELKGGGFKRIWKERRAQ